MLHVLLQQPDLEVAVRRELVEAQAAAAGLPLVPVMLLCPCTNEVYEDRMKAAVVEAKALGITHVAFGDLVLVDVRDYRVSWERDACRWCPTVLPDLTWGCRTFYDFA